MQWFDYALIKYTPNPKRGETINIGIVVFMPQTTDIMITSSYSKVRIIDGESTHEDLDRLKHSMLTMIKFCETPEESYDTLCRFSKGISLSNKGQFALDDLNQYVSKVKQLFEDLVMPYAARMGHKGESRLYTQLKNKFKSLELLAKDASELSKHKIVQNYPINENMGLTADFLLKNGIYHLSEVIDYNVNNTHSKLKETSLKMMTFMESKKTLHDEVNCYFVYSATQKKESEVIQHLNLAESYSNKMFNVNSTDDFKQYIAMVSELTQTEIPLLH